MVNKKNKIQTYNDHVIYSVHSNQTQIAGTHYFVGFVRLVINMLLLLIIMHVKSETGWN